MCCSLDKVIEFFVSVILLRFFFILEGRKPHHAKEGDSRTSPKEGGTDNTTQRWRRRAAHTPKKEGMKFGDTGNTKNSGEFWEFGKFERFKRSSSPKKYRKSVNI